MKYYAVKVGKTTGIFNSWSECQEAVRGFSSPEFRSFNSMEEAEAYLGGSDIYKEKVKEEISNGLLVAFCDGSFDETKKKYAYGVVIIDNEGNEHELCGSASNPKYISSKNTMGEVLGVVNVLDWAVTNGYSKVKIYHDLEGLAKWASGEWSAQSDVAKAYVGLLNEKYKNLVEIEFEKVKGHSNNYYNDKADALAKAALFEHKKILVKGENWFTIDLVKSSDLEAIIDLIKEDFPNMTVETTSTGLKTQHKLKLENKKLSVTLFKNGKNQLLAQGADSILFQIFVAFLLDLLGIDKVDYILKDAYRRNIDRDRVSENFSVLFPSFSSDYPDNIKKLLRQAIINLDYFIESEDYGQYAFPALKALEGHLKYLFISNGIMIKSKEGYKDYFTYNYATKKHILNEDVILRDPSSAESIEKCYNYVNSTRHTLFHFGDIIGITDSTRIIDTKNEADEIINKCFELISECM